MILSSITPRPGVVFTNRETIFSRSVQPVRKSRISYAIIVRVRDKTIQSQCTGATTYG